LNGFFFNNGKQITTTYERPKMDLTFIINNIKPCATPCVKRPMMGRSWYKCLGYHSSCLCAYQAKLDADYKDFEYESERNERLVADIKKYEGKIEELKKDKVIFRAEDRSENAGIWERRSTDEKLIDIKRWCEEFDVEMDRDIIHRCLECFSSDCYERDEDRITFMEREIIYFDEETCQWKSKDIEDETDDEEEEEEEN
jgi:hypothetical protein